MQSLDERAFALQASRMSRSSATARDGFDWTRWLRRCFGAGLALAVSVLTFNVLVDPYGSNPLRIRFERPLMDINQRFMYPQVLRSGEFDSAVFGTSTTRLLKPSELEAGFGGHFGNFAMNAATPFEQSKAVGLYLAHMPQLRAIVWGIDDNWCEKDATAPEKLLTERPFPPWLYEGSAWASIPHLFNLRTLEISSRVALNRLGRMKPRLPRNGYDVFLPPDSTYDAARAHEHIWFAKGKAQAVEPASPPYEASAGERASWRYPGVELLDETVMPFPQRARLIILLPPEHVAGLPQPRSFDEAYRDECKRRLAEIANAHRGFLLDFAIPSPLTREDKNFWDWLHYRLPFAKRITDALGEAQAGKTSAEDYRVVAASL